VSSQRLLDSETADPQQHLQAAGVIGQRLFATLDETTHAPSTACA